MRLQRGTLPGMVLGVTAFLLTPGVTYPLSVIPDSQIFAIGLDDAIYLRMLKDDGTWKEWTLTENYKVQDFTAVLDDRGFPELYAVDPDGVVCELHFDGKAHWSEAVLPGELRAKAIGATRDREGKHRLFAIGLDDRIYARHPRDREGKWWSPIGREKVKALSVVTNAQGNPQVFAIRLDGRVILKSVDARGRGEPWASTGTSQVKALAATVDARGVPQLFAIGLDDAVYSQSPDGKGGWGPWLLVNPAKVKGHCVSRDPQGFPQLYAISAADELVYTLKMTRGGQWGQWSPTGDGRVKK